MTENLKIEFFKNGVQDLITNLDIPVGACFLAMKDLTLQLESLYQQQVQKEYEEYRKEQQKKAEEAKENEEKPEVVSGEVED